MPKLSDTQSILLTAAAQRADGNLLPLPGSLRGGAATKVVAALLARGLVEEQTVESTAKADPALNTLWRNAEDGRGILLRIAPAGLDAIGIEADSAAVAAAGAERAGCGDRGQHRDDERQTGRPDGAFGQDAARAPSRRCSSAMLGRDEGATIAEVVAATGWQPHTVRGALRGRAEEAAGADHRVGEGRWAAAGSTASSTEEIGDLHCRRTAAGSPGDFVGFAHLPHRAHRANRHPKSRLSLQMRPPIAWAVVYPALYLSE